MSDVTPFYTRLYGLQEITSVIVSVLNISVHIIYYLKVKKELNFMSPTIYIWNWMTAVYFNIWFWLAVAQTRKKELIEVINYSCAFITVLTLLYCLLLRINYKGRIKIMYFLVTTGFYCIVLYTHLSHLWSSKVNWSFISRFTAVIGISTVTVLMIWWKDNYRKIPHIHLIGWFTISTVVVNLLEVADLYPKFWMFDAHSLWHAAAIPLVKVFYKFVQLDCLYLNKKEFKLIGHEYEAEKKSLKTAMFPDKFYS